MATMRQSMELNLHQGVLNITLSGPGKGNAMGPEFWAEMPQVIEEADQNDEIKVIVIKGKGDHFSYGLDLKAMLPQLGAQLQGELRADKRDALMRTIHQMQKAFLNIYICRKPVIAAIHGWCIGGAMSLIAASDIRICSAAARFSVREIKLAITCDLGALQWLPRIIGEGHTRELALTGKDIDAAEALRIGLINQVYPDQAELTAAADMLANEIAGNSAVVVQGLKQVMNYSADKSVEDGLQYVATWNAAFLQSNDLLESFAAISAGQKPDFNR